MKTNDTSMELTPIGRVHSDIQVPIHQTADKDLDPAEHMEEIKTQYQRVRGSTGRLEIFDAWEELMDGIEAFSHIMVIYWPHKLGPERRRLKKVHPMGRQDIPLQGIFATRSPARPNPVLVSVVKLLAREGNMLKVTGLDAVDGSPLIDIKPYIKPRGDELMATTPEWMMRLHRELGIETEGAGGGT